MLQPNIHLAVLTRRRHEFFFFCGECGSVFVSTKCNVDTQCIVHIYIYMYIYMCVCDAYMGTYANIHTYIHTYLPTYVRTYVHT